MSKRPPILTPYDIGYGKPPEDHRFKPGQSGNPKGRKKKPFRSVSISAFDELNRIITVKEGKTSSRISIGEALAKRVIAEAAKGNTRALQITLTLLASLPEEFRDQNLMREKQKMALDLVHGLLDTHVRYKKLYGDLPPIPKPTPDSDTGEDQ